MMKRFNTASAVAALLCACEPFPALAQQYPATPQGMAQAAGDQVTKAESIKAKLDASNVAQGAPADAACTTDNGVCSIVGLNKRALQHLTTLIGAFGSPFQVGGSIGNTAFGAKLQDASGSPFGTAGNPMRFDPTGSTTQPVSAASLPLPSGAATNAKLDAVIAAVGALGSSGLVTAAQLPATLGPKTAAGSLSITPASDAGMATAGNQTAANTKLDDLATAIAATNTAVAATNAKLDTLIGSGMFAYGFDQAGSPATRNGVICAGTADGSETGTVVNCHIDPNLGMYVFNTNGFSPTDSTNTAAILTGINTLVAAIPNSGAVAGVQSQGVAVTGGLMRNAGRAASTAPTTVADGGATDLLLDGDGRIAAQPAPNALQVSSGAVSISSTSSGSPNTILTGQGSGFYIHGKVKCWREDTGTTGAHVILNDTTTSSTPSSVVLPPSGGDNGQEFMPLNWGNNGAVTAYLSASGPTAFCQLVGYKSKTP